MSAQDLSTQFDADWQKAQERYQAGVNNRLSESDAAQLYLAPIQAKWKIIHASPQTFEDKKKMAKINADFEDAQVSATKNLKRGQPVDGFGSLMQKWASEVTADNSAVEQRDARLKTNALLLVNDGHDPLQIADQVPKSFFEDPKFVTSFTSAAEKAQGKWQAQYKADAKDNAPLTPEKQATLLGKIKSLDEQRATAPPSMTNVIADASNSLFNKLTGVRSEADSTWATRSGGGAGFTPPAAADIAPQVQGQPTAAAVAPAMPGQSFTAAPAAPAAAPEIPNPFGGSGVFNLDNFPGGRAAADAAVKESNAAWTARHPASQGGMYISDSPELSNQTRAEANAMWNAKFAPRMNPPTAAFAQAAAASPAVADVNTARDSYDVQQGAPTVTAMPKTKEELKTGQLYQTSRGMAVWDGQKFTTQ